MARRMVIALLLLAVPAPLAAWQGGEEIIVTGARRDADNYDERVPLIGLRRTADFAVQQVRVAGDTRDTAKRREEIFDMVRGAIAAAARTGDIELATGELVVEPLTMTNYRDLSVSSDGPPDTDKVAFLVKTRLIAGKDAKAALERITAFIKAVPAVGRAEMKAKDDMTLSVVRPEQYRAAILDLVADDARTTATRLGPDYAIEAKGLDRPVEWSRASLTDVFLYVPYSYAVVPKAR